MDVDEQREEARAGSRRRGVMVLALGAGLLAAAGCGIALTGVAAASTAIPPVAPASCASSAPHLTVEGSGQGSGTPDVLSAAFGFSTTASSSAAALSQNNTEVALALQALTSNGVARRDTQTAGLNLSAQYAYPHGVPTLTGYQATETITATLRKPSTEGTAIDDVVNATGNAAQVNSLTFSFGNPAAVQDKARTAAVHQAVAHAQAMAAAAGRKLGPVCSLTDNTQPPGLQDGQGLNTAALPASGATALPLEPGTQVESDDVTMVYALGR
jgi:uncharacterized protein YggE